MRIATLVLATILLAPPAAAQSLGSHNPLPVPGARAGEWGGTRSTPPRGGYREESVGEAPADAGVQRQAAKIRRDIRNARRSGQISRREARAFRRELGSTSGYARRSAVHGSMSYAAAAQAQSRLEGVRGRLIAARTRGISGAQPR